MYYPKEYWGEDPDTIREKVDQDEWYTTYYLANDDMAFIVGGFSLIALPFVILALITGAVLFNFGYVNFHIVKSFGMLTGILLICVFLMLLEMRNINKNYEKWVKELASKEPAMGTGD